MNKEEIKQFNVKITKCSSRYYWYYERIGEIFLVKESKPTKCLCCGSTIEEDYITISLINKIMNCKGFIKKNECVIVN